MLTKFVTRKHFCAGFFSKGGGACNRDAGGPGIVGDRLVGVVSFGTPLCGSPDAPTVFTKVGYYADWIHEIMDQRVPHGKARTTLQVLRHFSTPRYYYPIKPPTFKIPPISGKQKPIPISEVDALRQQKHREKIFLEYIETMFGSKGVKAFKDLYSERTETPSFITKPMKKRTRKHTIKVETTPPVYDYDHVEPRTVMEQIDLPFDEDNKSDEGMPVITYVTKKIKHDNRGERDIEFNKDLLDMFDEIDENQTLKNVSGLDDENMPINIDTSQLLQLLDNDDEDDHKNGYKNIPNVKPVLTYVYATSSDEDKTEVEYEDNDQKDVNEGNGGLSIPVEHFHDLTHRSKNRHNDTLGNFFRLDELYLLLSEITGNKSLTERK